MPRIFAVPRVPIPRFDMRPDLVKLTSRSNPYPTPEFSGGDKCTQQLIRFNPYAPHLLLLSPWRLYHIFFYEHTLSRLLV